MKKKLLIISVYPAPYRVEPIEIISNFFEVDVFFEHSSGDERYSNWFREGNYKLLDTRCGERSFKKALQCLKEYDLVIAYDYASIKAIKLLLKCRMYNVPYIINCDGVMLTKHGNPLKEIVKRILISKACKCFASGENAKKYFLKYGAKEENIVIHTFSTLHGNDMIDKPKTKDEKIEIRKKLQLPLDKKIAVAVGRFIPLKRYDNLIRAWKNMPPDYVLVLIGGGPEEANYRKLIAELEIDHIILDGFHPPEELFEYYKASDVFIHPTSYDVWGLVVNEAMACGLPVIVSNRCIAGLELVKNGENGYLVPMGNDEELCNRVLETCSDPDIYLHMSQEAINTIQAYTVESMAKVHVDTCKQILNLSE